MKFKLDENLSQSVAGLFRSAGYDTMTAREQGLQSAPDERVFDVAVREGPTLVTLDRDLGQVLRFPPGAHSPERSLWIAEPGRVRIHLARDGA
jgi:predicted nuclease of predicted toxin-antitoxin system